MGEITLKVIRPRAFAALENGDFIGSIYWIGPSGDNEPWKFEPFSGVIVGPKVRAKVYDILNVLNREEPIT